MNDLAVYQAACQPSEDAMILGWLGRLMCGVGNPPNEEEAPAKLAAMLITLRGLPRGVWNEQTLAQAYRTFRFWPPTADVFAMLKPHAERFRTTHEALENAARTGPARASTEPYNPIASPEKKPSTGRPAGSSRLAELAELRRRVRPTEADGEHGIPPPLRTVEEQLAILRRETEPVPA